MRRRDFIGGGAALAAALSQGSAQAGQSWQIAALAELRVARARILANFEHPAPPEFFALADAVACLGAYRSFARRSLEEQLLPEAQALLKDVARRVGRGVLHAQALMAQECGHEALADGLESVRSCLEQDAEGSLERSMLSQMPTRPEDLGPARRRLAKLRRLLPDLAVLGTDSGVFQARDPALDRKVRGLIGNEQGGPFTSGDLLLALGLLLLGVTVVGGAVVATAAICELACGGLIAPLLLAALAIAVALTVSVRTIKEARYRQLEQARGRYRLRAGHWTHTLFIARTDGVSAQIVRDTSRAPHSTRVGLHLPEEDADAILARCGDEAPFVVPEPHSFSVQAGRLSLSLNARSGLARCSVFLIPQAE